jgi:hypothetical protein
MREAFIRASGGSLTRQDPKKAAPRAPKISTLETTRALIKGSPDIDTIAKVRGLAASTILTHLESLRAAGTVSAAEVAHLVGNIDPRAREAIHAALRKVGSEKLRPAYDQLHEAYPFDTIRLARLTFEE